VATTDETSKDWLQPPAAQQGLKRYIETIRERIWLVITVVVLALCVAVAYVATADEVYEADASILVSPVSDEAGISSTLGLITESTDPLRAVETAATLIESTPIAAETADRLGLNRDPDDILEDISVEPVAESDIVTVTAEASSPEEAAELANTFARAAIDLRTTEFHERIDQELPVLEARLDELAPGVTRDTIAAQIAELEALRAGTIPTLRISEEAVEPDSPVAPRPLLSVVAALVAGLVLGLGGAFALQVLDPRLRREEQLRQRYRLPVLARVPRERASRDRPLSWSRLSAGSIEAYRTLRTLLTRPLARSGDSGSILVTSPGPSEGKTTTAVNLATSLALAGKSVILIEADLRHPAIGEALGAEAEQGMVSVLIEEATVEEALTTPDPATPNLRALLAERAGAWGGELLSLPAAQRLVAEAKQLADYVVIDSPPVATVIDALPLARAVEEVIIVVKLGTSRLARISELAELLAESDIKPAGFAVIGVAAGRESYYGEYRQRLVADRPERVPTASSPR
jgi:capsular exopolysaccharide synthesis family protein